MRDDTTAADDAPDEGALLAAYLDGDTDDVTTARIDRRLEADAALAARLDAIAATRARLQRLDEVTAPADVRARLRERLDVERAAVDTARGRAGHPGRGAARPPAEAERLRRWTTRAAPAMAAAAIALVTVLGAAAVLGQLGGGDSEESAGAEVSLDAGSGAEAAAPEAEAAQEAPGDDAADGAAGALEAQSADSGATPAEDGGGPAAAPVEGDADIAARAERLRGDAPEDLRTRERRLRDRAGLSTARLCVRELEAATVDLVDEDGRVALAVLMRGASPQIVLLDPRTCAAIRTISTQR